MRQMRKTGGCCGQGFGATRAPNRVSTYANEPVTVSYQAESGFKWWHGVLAGVTLLAAIVVGKKVL